MSPDRVFQQVNRVIDVSERRITKLADQVRSRAITIDQFKLSMRTEIKSLHLASSIAANGGLSQMTPARWGKVGNTLKREYGYLNKFGQELESGRLSLDSGRVRSRARAYTASARLTYWNTLNDRVQQSGMIAEASRKLGAVQTEHCPGCVSAAGAWMALEKLPAIGAFQCKWFCACSILYKLSKGPKLTEAEGSDLDERVSRATRAEPMPASELPMAARSRLNRQVRQGLIAKGRVNGATVYYADSAQAAGARGLVPEAAEDLTAKEQRVFNRVATSIRPVLATDLTQYEARVARALAQRGELRATRFGNRLAFARRQPSA